MDFVPILALGTLVYTFVILLKNLTAQQWRAAATQIVAWLAGIGGAFLMAEAGFARGISIGDTNLADLGSWSTVLVGLMVASLASTLHEFRKAIDRTDTAAVPDWFEAKSQAARRSHLVLPEHIATPDAMDEARHTIGSRQTSGKG